MGTKISFPGADGKPATGYLAKAAGHDRALWSSRNGGDCRTRSGASATGWLLPDMRPWRPTSMLEPWFPIMTREAAAREMNSLNFAEATDQVVRGAAQYLAKTGVKVGITGFCMGGAVAVLAACRVPEVSAAVVFYGLPPEAAFKASDIKVPLEGHYANIDDHITPKKVDAFEAALKRPNGSSNYSAMRPTTAS